MVQVAGSTLMFIWGILILVHVTEGQSGAKYYQDVLTNGTEPFKVEVNNDLKSSPAYPFNEYFTHQWNPVTKKHTVRMIKAIDRDGATAYTEDDVNILQYQLVCYETSGAAGEYKVLKVQINDLNDNTPKFINSPYSISVNELTPIGVTVFRGISATDLDEGANKQIFYSFSASPSQNFIGTTYFYLPSSQEGIVAVLNSLDFESMYSLTGNAALTYYDITVTVRDNPSLPSSPNSNNTNIRILILDGDDQGPEFVYPSCIISSQPNSKSCIRPKYLSSVPSGSSSEITLDLIPDPPVASNPTSTVLMLMQDRDTLNSNITCRISKTEPPGYENYFTATYSFYSGKQHKCEIKKNAGQILYRNNVASLEILVEAVEQSPNLRVDYATVVVYIQLTNRNASIITYNSNIGYIYENSLVGSRTFIDTTANTTLMRLTFTDPDKASSDPQPQFDITVNNGNLFSVSQDGYVVLNNAVLDYETATQYILTVTVTKSGSSNSTSATVTINVLNINDNNPIISTPDNYIVTVSQGDYSSSPRPLVNVAASDVDFGPPLYSISRVVPSNSANKFTVDNTNGLVTLRSSVNAGDVYTIYVSAADQGNPVRSTEAVVIVTVTPLTNQTPSFSSGRYIIYISEGVLIGSSLFTLPVTDADTPLSSLTYSLSNESPAQANTFFASNGSTLINVRSFDRENIPEHNITVTVRDPQGNTAQAQVTVIVTDVNDNDPSFTSPAYTFSITEGQPSGTLLGTVTASDNDQPGSPNSLVSYSIVVATDSNLFSINSSNGLMTTNNVFDYETKKQYLIFVRAADNGNPSRASVVPVTVNVIDVNDNPPLFEETSREVNVQENVVNVTVVSLNATDADSIPNINFILRNIGSNTDANTFIVQTIGNQARITVNGALDYETKNLYQFLLTTVDGQNSASLFPSATITVHVLDVNDRTPVIGSFNPTVTVLENVAIGYPLQTIPATDADGTAPNNIIRYNIISTSPNSTLFYIGEKTGQLLVANSLQLDRTINLYTLHVQVQDNGTPSKYDIAVVSIYVNRNLNTTCCFVNNSQKNLYPPTITPSSDIGFIYENSAIGSRVFNDNTTSKLLRLDIQDPDSACPFPFDIFVQPESPFKVTQDGYFQVINDTLDYEISTKYSLIVTIIENNAERYSTSVTIMINILNLNDNSPVMKNDNPVVSLPQGEYKSYRVMQLQATDADFGPIVFELSKVVPSTPSSKFSVSPNGELSFQGIISPGDVYTVYVTATDQGKPRRSTDAFVVVMGNSSFNSIKSATSKLNVGLWALKLVLLVWLMV